MRSYRNYTTTSTRGPKPRSELYHQSNQYNGRENYATGSLSGSSAMGNQQQPLQHSLPSPLHVTELNSQHIMGSQATANFTNQNQYEASVSPGAPTTQHFSASQTVPSSYAEAPAPANSWWYSNSSSNTSHQQQPQGSNMQFSNYSNQSLSTHYNNNNSSTSGEASQWQQTYQNQTAAPRRNITTFFNANGDASSTSGISHQQQSIPSFSIPSSNTNSGNVSSNSGAQATSSSWLIQPHTTTTPAAASTNDPWLQSTSAHEIAQQPLYSLTNILPPLPPQSNPTPFSNQDGYQATTTTDSKTTNSYNDIASGFKNQLWEESLANYKPPNVNQDDNARNEQPSEDQMFRPYSSGATFQGASAKGISTSQKGQNNSLAISYSTGATFQGQSKDTTSSESTTPSTLGNKTLRGWQPKESQGHFKTNDSSPISSFFTKRKEITPSSSSNSKTSPVHKLPAWLARTSEECRDSGNHDSSVDPFSPRKRKEDLSLTSSRWQTKPSQQESQEGQEQSQKKARQTRNNSEDTSTNNISSNNSTKPKNDSRKIASAMSQLSNLNQRWNLSSTNAAEYTNSAQLIKRQRKTAKRKRQRLRKRQKKFLSSDVKSPGDDGGTKVKLEEPEEVVLLDGKQQQVEDEELEGVSKKLKLSENSSLCIVKHEEMDISDDEEDIINSTNERKKNDGLSSQNAADKLQQLLPKPLVKAVKNNIENAKAVNQITDDEQPSLPMTKEKDKNDKVKNPVESEVRQKKGEVQPLRETLADKKARLRKALKKAAMEKARAKLRKAQMDMEALKEKRRLKALENKENATSAREDSQAKDRKASKNKVVGSQVIIKSEQEEDRANIIPDISAFSMPSLTIRNIGQSGAPEMIRFKTFPSQNDREDPSDMRAKDSPMPNIEVAKVHTSSESSTTVSATDQDQKSASSTSQRNKNDAEKNSERINLNLRLLKSRLQLKLMEKAKASKKAQSANEGEKSNGTPFPSSPEKSMVLTLKPDENIVLPTLEKPAATIIPDSKMLRERQLQLKESISSSRESNKELKDSNEVANLNGLVQKQQRMLQHHGQKIRETKTALKICNESLEEEKDRVTKSEAKLKDLFKRKKAMENMVLHVSQKLVRARKMRSKIQKRKISPGG